jgi:tRNA nucleotidyltransferase (CCA-adding enzyme)
MPVVKRSPSHNHAEITLDPPRAVREIAAELERAGHETWCVGGAVRDAFLGIPHLDWDLATSATPEQVQRVFRRTRPVGLRFGTVGVIGRDGMQHEITTFRRDVRPDGRHTDVEFGASLDEDLARRDFTINAIAFSPKTGELRDPFDGRSDLSRGVVRAVGAPHERMREDYLRALRALRFAGRFEFTIDATTWEAIVASAPHLTRLSRERVREEIEKTMKQVRQPSRTLALWERSGALRVLLPLAAGQGRIAFESADALPLPGATFRRGRDRERLLLRIASMFLGMPYEEVRRALRDLRFANDQVSWISHLAGAWRDVGEHVGRALRGEMEPTNAEIRRWAATAGRTDLAPFLRVGGARVCTETPIAGRESVSRRLRSLYRRALRIAYRDPVGIGDLVVDGEDLMSAGIERGPILGRVLRELLDAVLEDPALNTRETLLQLARDMPRRITPRSSHEGG